MKKVRNEIASALPFKKVAQGVGRRKSAVARVWLRTGKGDVKVNGRDLKDYFNLEPARVAAVAPFNACAVGTQFDVEANIQGGGVTSQAGALSLGIARALLAFDEEARSTLRKHGLLTRDPRGKERKKYGQKAARRKFQFVKR